MTQKKIKGNFDLFNLMHEAIAESDLTAPQSHLLLVFLKFINANGECFPSYNTLQRYSKMSRPTLFKSIKSLCEKEWLSYEKGNNAKMQSNRYQINLSKLGIGTKTAEVINIKNNIVDGYPAEDGNIYESRIAYEIHKQKLKGSK